MCLKGGQAYFVQHQSQRIWKHKTMLTLPSLLKNDLELGCTKSSNLTLPGLFGISTQRETERINDLTPRSSITQIACCFFQIQPTKERRVQMVHYCIVVDAFNLCLTPTIYKSLFTTSNLHFLLSPLIALLQGILWNPFSLTLKRIF